MRKFWRKNWKSLLMIILLVGTLPLSVPLAQKAWKYLTGASYKPAALVVQVDQAGAEMPRPWEALAQGHESKDLRLDTAVPFLRGVGVKYVRIDNILNGFDVVSRGDDGKLRYDFTKLDLLVSDILAMGATPFLAVSYMPPAISSGDITDLPRDWGEYAQVVASFVGRYSRDYRGGIPNIVYEIWNEPDLFGGFKTYGAKNYLTLYRVAANAAVGVRGAKPFLIGGPATTGLYRNWITDFYTKLSDVRIDFYSWHRYSSDPSDFVRDAELATNTIAPLVRTTQKLFITEWGINAERGSVYDGRVAAAHFLAVARALIDTNVDLALAFEVQDGTTGETQFHGGWGMLTNPKYGAVAKKPRFRAFEFLQKVKGARIPIAGEGSSVTALAVKEPTGAVKVMAVNYDSKGAHEELFPMTFAGFAPGVYTITEEYLSGRKLSVDVETPNGMLKREIVLSPSDAVIVSVVAK